MRGTRTYAIRNLLPSRPICPFSFVSEAVLAHIYISLATLGSQLGKRLRAVTQLVDRSGSVAVNDHISFRKKLFELLTSLRSLQIQFRRMLAHVHINLEKWNIAEIRAGNLDNIGSVFSQNSCDTGACNDAAELKNFDAVQNTGLRASGVCRHRCWWRAVLEILDRPWRQAGIQFSL